MSLIKQTKQLLADSLGDLAQDYWQALQDYLLSKTTKKEFDVTLLSTLTTQTQKRLHNKLLILLLTSTRSVQVQRNATSDFTSKRDNQRGLAKQLINRFNSKTIISLPPVEKERLLKMSLSIPLTMHESHNERQDYGRNCEKLYDLPSTEQLQSRTSQIAASYGLDVGGEVVGLIDSSVKLYLKQIVSNATEIGPLNTESLSLTIDLSGINVDPDLIEAINMQI